MMELDLDNQAEEEDKLPQVFESAGGFTPTIGIIGAVLGLIQVMQHLDKIDGSRTRHRRRLRRHYLWRGGVESHSSTLRRQVADSHPRRASASRHDSRRRDLNS